MFEGLDFSQAKFIEPEEESNYISLEEPGEEVAAEEVEETPAAEETPAPDEQPAPETEETVAETEVPAEEPVEETPVQETAEEVFARTLREKYNVGTVEELLEQQKPKEEQPAYSEQIKKLIEWEAKGLKPEDYFRTQTMDFEAMSDMDKVRNLYAMENPDLTREDIDLLIEDEFKTNDEEYSEKEVRLGQLRLKQRSKEALPKLKEWQVKAATPAASETSRAAQEAQLAYRQAVDAQMRGFDAIEIPLDDKGEKFSYSIAGDRAGVDAIIQNVDTFFNDYVATDAQGKPAYKVRELARDIYIAKNFTKLAREIAAKAEQKGYGAGLEKGKSEGKKQIEKEIVNSPDPARKAAATGTDNSPLARLGRYASQGII